VANRTISFVLSLLLAGSIASAQEVGSAACSACHQAIARRYAVTPMAQSSGPVSSIRPSPAAEPVTDPSTRATFRPQPTAQAIKLNIERELPRLTATRDLTYFIGSGRIGRSFLFEQDDGFLYQSPVSWYADSNSWRASPGFQRRTTVDLTRPVEPTCLLCHASRLQQVSGAQNRYDTKQPFLESGIGCERCHGPGQRHVAAMKTAAREAARTIINPAKLPAAQRDSICAQCHLTGAARVARAANTGRTAYKPGDDLARTVAVFVWAGARDAAVTVTSHFEKLAWSRCKQAAGDKLWCGTCHSPHGAPVNVRERCVTCHATKPCKFDKAARLARNDECHSCHMPKSEVQDAEHAVYTDHSIPRRAQSPVAASAPVKELVPFWTQAPADPRDLALAYAVTALTEPSVRRQAFDLLRSAEAKYPADLPIAAQLAQFYDRLRQPTRALPLFERVVAGNPGNTAALINLGTLYAQADRLPEAIALWQRALAQNPALTQARINVAVAQIRLGDREAGISSLRVALNYDPDNVQAAEMLRQLKL
jgi:hypothetical protein